MNTNKLDVVELLDKDEVACCDEDVVACFDEDVLTCLDKNDKDYFDGYFIQAHPLNQFFE